MKRSVSIRESEIPKKRSKSQFAHLTSDPVALSLLLKKIENGENDVVKEYLAESNGEELINFLESGHDRKSSELAVILKILATILVRTRTDLNQGFGEVGRRLAEGVLEDAPLSVCFRAIKSQSSADAAKASLQLLAAVVSTDPLLLGRSLLRSINFENPDWIQISRRRNTKDPNDVRTCFINLIAAFLVSGNNLLVRELLESKNAINLVLSDIFIDKAENVLLMTTLLRTIVCEGSANGGHASAVSKTVRMRVFTRVALRRLADLYAWRGEALSARTAIVAAAASGTAEAELADPVLAASRTAIRSATHALLRCLATSTANGLVFRERTCLDSAKQNEHLLSLLVSPPMDSAWTDELRRELVMDCLLSCPSLFSAYLSYWKPSMTPRDSGNWHSLMQFVEELFSAFRPHLVRRASQLLELSHDVNDFVVGICDVCLPPSCITEPIHSAFQHDSEAVVNRVIRIYKAIRQNMIVFLTWLYTSEDLKTKAASPQSVIEAIIKILPERLLVDKWVVSFTKILHEEHTDTTKLAGQALPVKSEELNDDDEEEEVNLGAKESKNVPSPEETIAQLPEKFRSRLSMLHKVNQNPSSEVSDDDINKLIKVWPEMAPECLLSYWQYPVVLNCLASSVRLFGQKGKAFIKESMNPSPKKLLKIIASKEVFKQILMEKSAKLVAISTPLTPVKAALLNLLLSITEVAPKVVGKKIPLVSLLAAYGGTLSICDRFLLQIIYLLSFKGFSLCNIWGMTGQNLMWGDRLIEHYRFGMTLGEVPQLWREPGAGAFMSVLDKDRLLSSALSFPVTRRCLAQSMSSDGKTLDSHLYDPCFLLPLFLRYLTSGDNEETQGLESMNRKPLDLRGFYAHNCLAYAVGALSSYSRHLRGLAKSVIARFRGLSEAWKPVKMPGTPFSVAVMKQFPEHRQLNFMLDTLRNSLSMKAKELGGGRRSSALFSSRADTSFRLSRLHANFFIHAIGILVKPEHRMYEVFWNTFMAKPAIDLDAVPDFVRIVFSVHRDYRVERQWMMRLCAQSLLDGDTSEYLLLEKSRVFKHALLLYNDPAVDATTQIHILRLLMMATRIPRACHALTRFHAFPLWLFRNALSTTHAPSLSYFFTIISQMLSAFEEAKETSPCLAVLRLLQEAFGQIHGESTFAKRNIKKMTS